MKSLPFSRLFVYACLLLAFACLMIMPSKTVAATGSAHCAGGPDVSCSAYRCDCQDNVGCTAYDIDGRQISSETHLCASDSFQPEEGAH
jgi:hypothetical protein